METEGLPLRDSRPFKAVYWAGIVFALVAAAFAVDNPMSAHVDVTPVQSYSGGKTLTRPAKILVYNFEVKPEDVQVDRSQEIRLRHLLEGDEKPAKVGEKASEKLSAELIKQLKKTGIPVEAAKEAMVAPDDALMIQGSFISLKQGDKTERVAVGMGTGSAEVRAKVQVHLKTAQESVLFSEFETKTTLGKNVGAGVPMAVGMNPAAAAGRATISDRKKTIDAYSSKTGDAAAKAIISMMARQGWVKVDDKGNVVK